MQYLCSPAAQLKSEDASHPWTLLLPWQSWGGVLFPVLCCGPVNVGGHAPSLKSPAALLKPEGTIRPHRVLSSITSLWWSGVLHLWVWLDNNSQKIFGRLPHPGHGTDNRLKHTPSLPVKMPIWCHGASAGGSRLLVHCTSEYCGMEVLLRKVGWGHHLCALPRPS